jgi:hypothetical protein
MPEQAVSGAGGKEREEEAKRIWDQQSEPVQLHVHHGGGTEILRKNLKTKKGLHENLTWNVGDIDFDTDGSIFIRNPYLADAIQGLIARNRDKMEKGELLENGKPQFLFRLTRDEGWSGEKQNMVC